MSKMFLRPGVKAYTGLWGSGKTLAMTEECMYLESKGVEIFTNYGFDGGQHIESFDDLIMICADPDRRRRHIAMDELGMLLSARQFRDWPAALDTLFLQGRKFGVTLSYSVQDFEMVDSNVRRLTGLVCECRGHLWRNVAARGEAPDSQARLFSRAWRSVGKAKITKKRSFIEFRTFRPETGARYDTYALVETCQRVLSAQAAAIARQPSIVVVAGEGS